MSVRIQRRQDETAPPGQPAQDRRFRRSLWRTGEDPAYYDQIELFNPAYVDRLTDYRYYSRDQLPRINRILALKDLGLSLKQIDELLADDLALAELQGMLRIKRIEIQQSRAQSYCVIFQGPAGGTLLVQDERSKYVAIDRSQVPDRASSGDETSRQMMRSEGSWNNRLLKGACKNGD